MRDDFSNQSAGHEPTTEFNLYPGNQPITDTCLSAIEIIQELEWSNFLDPGGLQKLLKRQEPCTLPPETEAIALLSDLLDHGEVTIRASGTLAVNWGDGTAVETFGPGQAEFDPDHAHYFAKNGQYQVLIAYRTKATAPVDFRRLILQVRNETAEITMLRSIGLE